MGDGLEPIIQESTDQNDGGEGDSTKVAQTFADQLRDQFGKKPELPAGVTRTEKPAGTNFASLYRLDLSPQSRVILRGFGVFFGDNRWGGVFLRRFSFNPQLTPSSDFSRPAWSTEELPPLISPPADRALDCQH